MQYESMIKTVAELARDAAVGVAAGAVVTLMEAYPAFQVAITSRMLRSSFERMQRQFAAMGVDTTGLSSAEQGLEPRRESRKVWH